jgi:hypothetical protein
MAKVERRNCLENPNGLDSGVPRVGITRREAPLSPLCATKICDPYPSSYFPNSFLEGKLDLDRYEARISQIKRSRKTVEEELLRIKNRTAHIECLEHDRDALLSHYARIAAVRLDELEPEERNRVYKMLRLTVFAHGNGDLEANWAFGEDLCRDNVTLPLGNCCTAGR